MGGNPEGFGGWPFVVPAGNVVSSMPRSATLENGGWSNGDGSTMLRAFRGSALACEGEEVVVPLFFEDGCISTCEGGFTGADFGSSCRSLQLAAMHWPAWKNWHTASPCQRCQRLVRHTSWTTYSGREITNTFRFLRCPGFHLGIRRGLSRPLGWFMRGWG